MHMKTSPLPQLQVFVTVARLRSFSAAARELSVSTSAVSQAVKQLEEQLGVTLLRRTTRSVSLTEAGQRLLDGVGPALEQALATFHNVASQPDEIGGRLRLSVPRAAVPLVIAPMLPTFRRRYPRVEVEVVIDDRFVDLVAEGYDAGVRLSEAIERDMVQVRLTDPFRFVVVGSPSYLERHGAPQRPEDLLRHECIVLRAPSTGTLYAWELERGQRTWRVPVRGCVITNDGTLMVRLAEEGLGMIYALEPLIEEPLRAGRLRRVLEDFAPTVPGFFLYYPSRAQRSPTLRLFVDVVREQLARPHTQETVL